MKRNKNQANKIATKIASFLLAATLIAGCQPDESDSDGNGSNASNAGNGASTGGITPPPPNEDYRLSLPNQTVNLTEGSEVTATIRIERGSGYTGQVTIGARAPTQGDGADLAWTFSNTKVADNENATSINVKLGYNALPIQPQTRSLEILASDGVIQRSALLTINVAPTNLPDVYLLIGQSNMVGFSEENAKQADFDAPVDRILQLNVTGNDQQNFRTLASFTSVDSIAVASPRFTPAIDPLHHGYDSRINGKGGTQVGLGLSFAKSAITNTQASNIYLVPAAWADTGFCRRDRTNTELEGFEGFLGWNATAPPALNTVLSGTLLHDRAIARTNLTLQEKGGILRGILWHQGEADAQNPACAEMYQQNLAELVASLRTNIVPDARGPSARGPNANIPFVAGTMSKGEDYVNQPQPKILVDTVHRNIKQIVPFSAFVDNDDLIPPNYPCGDAGDCIHFGARAYRLMGSRYYVQLLEAATSQ